MTRRSDCPTGDLSAAQPEDLPLPWLVITGTLPKDIISPDIDTRVSSQASTLAEVDPRV